MEIKIIENQDYNKQKKWKIAKIHIGPIIYTECDTFNVHTMYDTHIRVYKMSQ